MTDRTVLRLLSGTLAAVLLPLGLAFVGVGLLAQPPEGGGPFVSAGGAALGAATLMVAAFAGLSRAEAAERRRREAGVRAPATVLRTGWDPGVRVGGRIALELTVRLPTHGVVTRRALVSSAAEIAEGAEITVRYDPADPANFEPLPGAEWEAGHGTTDG